MSEQTISEVLKQFPKLHVDGAFTDPRYIESEFLPAYLKALEQLAATINVPFNASNFHKRRK